MEACFLRIDSRNAVSSHDEGAALNNESSVASKRIRINSCLRQRG